MSELKTKLSGPDLTKGVAISTVADGAMLLGHAHGESALLARRGDELFAIGNVCTHYGAPLNEGLLVDDTVRCPWHHACFSLRTGEALRAPALNPVSCWRVEQRDDTVYVREKLESVDQETPPVAAGMPGSVLIVGGGAAGNAAAEMLRREGYVGRVTLLSADESVPCDRPNLSKGYLAGTAPAESNPLRSADFYKQHDIDLKLGARVATIDPASRNVELVDGSRFAYDALLLAWRGSPARPLFAHARRQPRSCRQGAGCAAGRGDWRELHRTRGGGITSSTEYRSECGRAGDMSYGENPRSGCREFHPQTP
jgi:apoptosis-inducing factor 3